MFGTINRHGSHGHGSSKKTVQGVSASAEDNGFNMDLSFPLTRKLTFSADYSHSLIQAEDIVGLSVTWVLRLPRKAEAMSPANPISNQGQ